MRTVEKTMKRKTAVAAEGGFTLLELLIAMSLLVLIVTITMGALRLASRSVEAGERRMESLERFRMVTSILDAQIQSHLPLTHEEQGNREYYFRGDGKSIRLATSYSLWGGRHGQVIVDYRVEYGPGGGQTLYAEERMPGIEGKRETRLFTDASEISFEYYYEDQLQEAGTWSEQWSDGTVIPEMIRLHVRFGSKKYFFIFPVRTRGELLPAPMTPFPAAGGLQ